MEVNYNLLLCTSYRHGQTEGGAHRAITPSPSSEIYYIPIIGTDPLYFKPDTLHFSTF